MCYDCMYIDRFMWMIMYRNRLLGLCRYGNVMCMILLGSCCRYGCGFEGGLVGLMGGLFGLCQFWRISRSIVHVFCG